jgi:hypothetical protein
LWLSFALVLHWKNRSTSDTLEFKICKWVFPLGKRNEQRQNMGNYTRLTVYTDGASRGNPGLAAAGIHIVDETASATVADLRFALGIATNNVAEYQAVLHAVKWLLADDIHINFCLDSQLVVLQLSGLWEIKDPKMQEATS